MTKAEHEIQGHTCITCTIKRVREAVDSPPIQEEVDLAHETINEYMANLTAVKWAIEDEEEREKWQDLLMLSAVDEFYHKNKGVVQIEPLLKN